MSQNSEHSKAKREWLTKKIKHFKNNGPSVEIAPQPRPERLPLSFSQIRLWFLEQWEPGSSAYLLPYAWRLHGPLNMTALSSSLDQLVARHETLRTTFSSIDGHPAQIIEAATPIMMPFFNLSEPEESLKEIQCRKLIHEEATRGFDLQAGPLIRAKLIRLGHEEHVLLLTFHHIITDGWSMGIFLKEFNALYTAHATRQPPHLLPLPIQFADFAIWQRQRLQGEELDRQLQYWQTQLQNSPHQLELPTDRPRPPQPTYQGRSISFTLPSPLGQAINTLCRTQGITLFMGLMAAFQILLFRYTGQRDFLIGTPIAGRSHSELENLIGFFVNTLVLRVQIQEHPTFRQVLHHVRDRCLDAYAHQDLPFEKLVEVLQPERDPSRHPLFQVLFQLDHRDQRDELTLADLRVTNISQDTHTAKFDLSLAMASDSEILQGTFIFNTDIFENSRIRRLANNFQILLERLIRNPNHPITQISLLTDAERHQLLFKWNGTTMLPSEAKTVHELFAEEVALTPDAIAIVFDDQQLTYHELNERANRLAHFLQTKKVGPEVRIGICLERGLDLIIGLLGVLKAGGAYVPLDPSVPLERLCLMIKDAKTSIVITSEILRSKVESCQYLLENSKIRSVSFLTLDSVGEYENAEDCSLSFPIVHTDNLAYIMYTSGSTGKPKGVEITHRNIVRLVHKPTYFQWPHDAVFLQWASPAFDAATFEIWTCLVNGGTLVLGPSRLPSLDEFGELLQNFQITVLWLTAGLFHQMVDWNVQALCSIQRLLAGGDVLSPRHVMQVMNQLPTCQVINGYGPTENTTFTCCFPIPSDNDFQDSIPIGKPIHQTQVYVLDPQQHLLPIGTQGELCIGGLGLARGYHHQPDLTAQLFIPHPYSTSPGARIYRSGDIVRYRNEDHLIFLRRRDRQVKVRGYRVECGEIELSLTKHTAVHETIVLSWEDSMKNTRLVAYVVSRKGSTPSIFDLRFFLSQTLPSYMIPTEYVFLDEFPLTPNGKVNRKALPAPDQIHQAMPTDYIQPRNSLERQLTKIWEVVLGRQPIGVTDNFFILGGESLMAVRLCSEIERALQRKVPVTLIFHAQTIEQLAVKIGQNEECEPRPQVVPIQACGSHPPIFGVLFGATFMPFMKNYPDQPYYMFFNQGHDGLPARHTTVEEIARWYLKEMRTMQPHGPYYLAGYSFGGMVAYEMAQQLRRQGQTIALLALVDPTPSFPHAEPTPWKIRLGRLFTDKTDRGYQEAPYLTRIPQGLFPKICSGSLWRLQRLKRESTVTIKKKLCNMFFVVGAPLPPFIRPWYRNQVVQEASRQYIPQKYTGPVVLFKTNNRVEMFWRNLCDAVVQVHDFPTGHLDLVDGPETKTLLEKLMESLTEAHQKQGRNEDENPH